MSGKHLSSKRTGLYLYGDMHPKSKLTWDQVEEIRREYLAGEKQAYLAKKYNVSQGLISKIVNHYSWAGKGYII